MSLEGQPLKGKIALVTGGSRGIGGGITRKLASWGCTLCITYIDRPGPAKQIAAELKAKGTDVSLHRMDFPLPTTSRASSTASASSTEIFTYSCTMRRQRDSLFSKMLR